MRKHRAIIITGGLGPTSDDLTRFALSKAIKRPLHFEDSIWDIIVARLAKIGYTTPPESNRQQALFPEGTTIIPNSNGTAAGCMICHQDRWIFMLPGPPSECLPMVDTVVIPTLLKAGFNQVTCYDSWLLFGVSEGYIAEILDELAKPFQCITGYRICYPYIEFKIQSNSENDFATLKKLVETAMAAHLLNGGKETASSQLRKKLETYSKTLTIHDHATGGLLESLLVTPKTYQRINFHAANAAIHIKGLTAFWEDHTQQQTSLSMTLMHKGEEKTLSTDIPLRGERVKLYAVEWICYQLCQFIR